MTHEKNKPVVMDEEDAVRADMVACPVDHCKSVLPRAQMVKGVCPKCASAFKAKHEKHFEGRDEGEVRQGTKGADGGAAGDRPLNGCFGEHGEHVESTEDAESGDGWMTRLAFDTGVNSETLTEIVATIEQRHRAATADEERAMEFKERQKAAAGWLLDYDGNKFMAEHCYFLVLGLYDVIGCRTAVDIARKCTERTGKFKIINGKKHWVTHRVQKATVDKCIHDLESRLNTMFQYKKLPPLPGQRSDEARENMSRVATSGWHRAPKI